MKGGSRPAARALRARGRDAWFYAALLLLIAAAYGQVWHFGFINCDDPIYVTGTPQVRAGLSADGVSWAFTTTRSGNWFPLTWISHMAVCQFFDTRGGAHHLTNVMLHAASTLLLFALLKRATGARWPSALVAFLFGLHPLHVESVAWISERKDVLSAFFWTLALRSYLSYASRPRPAAYLLTLLLFCLGLMSKAMVITLPLVLLLLDVWPLERVSSAGLALRALWEKLPFLAVSIGMAVATFAVQRQGGEVRSLEAVPIQARLGNALVSLAAYVVQMFRPIRLALFYPRPAEQPLWLIMTAGLAIAGITALAVWLRASRPYLAVGWFWYLVTILPVIGLVQVGDQAHADRYTYLPMIGLSIMLAWSAAEAWRRWPRLRSAWVCAAGAACLACMRLTAAQTGYWQNSASLFRHAIEVTDGNYIAYTNLGDDTRDAGRADEAVLDYQQALRIHPRYNPARVNLGMIRLEQGRTTEALTLFKEAVRIWPDYGVAHKGLGSALKVLGRKGEAIAEFQRAVQLDRNDAEALSMWGSMLADQGQTSEALDNLYEAVRMRPDSALTHYNLGLQLGKLGRAQEATAELSEAVRLQPENIGQRHALGIALGVEGRLREAEEQFRAVLRVRPDDAGVHVDLGKALANLGRLDEAIAQFREALRISPESEEARQDLARALSLQAGAEK